jgi:hypothetical protein
LQRYSGKLLGRMPHWPTQCRRDSFMPLIPELERHDGKYDLVAAVGFPFTLFAYSAWRLFTDNFVCSCSTYNNCSLQSGKANFFSAETSG